MILGKKVVAVEGKHIPKYRNVHSPLIHSSVKCISLADEFNLESIPNANPEDLVTNLVAWGNNGKIDLTQVLFKQIKKRIL